MSSSGWKQTSTATMATRRTPSGSRMAGSPSEVARLCLQLPIPCESSEVRHNLGSAIITGAGPVLQRWGCPGGTATRRVVRCAAVACPAVSPSTDFAVAARGCGSRARPGGVLSTVWGVPIPSPTRSAGVLPQTGGVDKPVETVDSVVIAEPAPALNRHRVPQMSGPRDRVREAGPPPAPAPDR